VRPAAFGWNAETAASNAFQSRPAGADVAAQALREFDGLVAALDAAGVGTVVVPDTPVPVKPDAVFPNNWFSTHPDGSVVLYPMEAANRRLERRRDVLEKVLGTGRFIDLSPLEQDNQFLEGTGSLIIDHARLQAWASLSSRTHPQAIAEFTKRTGIAVHSFRTADPHGRPYYHTNVLLSLGERFAVFCPAALPDPAERKAVADGIAATRELIELTPEQVGAFAANILELRSSRGHPVIALSATARRSLTAPQLRRLHSQGEIVALPIPTIETVGGGSVRCMLAELY